MTGPFSAQLFEGKHVFVAGGSSGINLRIAQRYAAACARVSIFSRDPAKIDRLARLPNYGADVTVCVDDVENVAGLSAAAQKYDGPGVCVPNQYRSGHEQLERTLERAAQEALQA